MPGNDPRKRFYKPVCHIDKTGKPLKCLEDIYMLFELPDIREDLTLWQQLATCTEGHVYDEAAAREDLMEYASRLILLCEAFYVIYALSDRAKQKDNKLRVSKKIRKKIHMRRRLVLLTAEQIKEPYTVINDFCIQFTHHYARTELTDMVDAVVSYKGIRKIYRGNIILLYRCLQSLLKLARSIHISQQDYSKPDGLST